MRDWVVVFTQSLRCRSVKKILNLIETKLLKWKTRVDVYEYENARELRRYRVAIKISTNYRSYIGHHEGCGGERLLI